MELRDILAALKEHKNNTNDLQIAINYLEKAVKREYLAEDDTICSECDEVIKKAYRYCPMCGVDRSV